MNYAEITGTYGSGKTETTIYTATDGNGATWYVCDGSLNVNRTYDELSEGVNVEELSDFDMFTASRPVESLEDLERQINREEEEETEPEEEAQEEEEKPIYEKYDFNAMPEFYDYIIESKINGNPAQVKQLLTECTPEQIKNFIQFVFDLAGEVSRALNDSEMYCKNIALEVLTERVS